MFFKKEINIQLHEETVLNVYHVYCVQTGKSMYSVFRLRCSKSDGNLIPPFPSH